MESGNLRDSSAPQSMNSEWLNHAVGSAYERVLNNGLSVLAKGEHFVQEHKMLAATVTGAVAVAATLAFRGRAAAPAEEIESVAQKFLPDASKLFKPDLIDFDAAKIQKLTEDAGSSDWRRRYMAVSSWDAPPELLASLARDEHLRVREMVAKNPLTPKEVLKSMSVHDTEDVRDAAEFGLERRTKMQLVFARDPRASAGTLHRIATEDDQIPRLKEAVALNRQSSPQTLKVLAADSDADVRTFVAMHPRTPVTTLDELSRDSNYHVRQAAATNPFVSDLSLARLTLDRAPGPRFEVANHLYASSEQLEHLARDTNYVVRAGVAANAKTGWDVLKRLSDDSERSVREAVAGNPNVDAATLEALANDDEGLVRIAARKAMRSKLK